MGKALLGRRMATPMQIIGIGLIAMTAALLWASSASAFDTYLEAGSFAPEVFTPGRSIAADEASGAVMQAAGGEGSVKVFSGDLSGAEATVVQGLIEPKAVAVDQS